MQKSKKVKVDMNPKRVTNPAELHKRNPGKFDQKIYMEQENFSSHAIKEMARIHAMQVNSVSMKYDKDIIAIKRKKKQLESKNTGYAYLKQLRQAFNEESERRDSLARKLEEFARKQAEPEPEVIEEVVEEPVKNYKPWENVQPTKLPEINKQKTVLMEEKSKSNFGNAGCGGFQAPSLEDSFELPSIDDQISTPERNKLEKLSRDIITATLPVDRLKRILPPETKGSGATYPIMSYYRRSIVLPEVKKIKRRLGTHANELHSKINNYFGTQLPLSSYTIPKSAKPHKLRLLKAISHDNFRLPEIPPEYR